MANYDNANRIMDCSFIKRDGLWTCSTCGYVHSQALPEAPRRNCPDKHLECRFRGEPIRQEKDRTCGCPNKFIDVFSCAIHGECTKRKYLDYGQTIQDCLHCKIENRGFRESTFPREVQDTIDLTAVTSLAPDDRARDAIESWRDAGLRVVAVQCADEVEQVKSIYGNLVDEWIPVTQDGRWIFNRKCVFIWSITDLAVQWNQPILIINSDIEIHGSNERLRLMRDEAADGTLAIGIRHNYADWRQPTIERHGLDVFCIGPQMARTLPRISLCMGIPWWDYWLPKHSMDYGFGFTMHEEPIFYHRNHKQRWGYDEWVQTFLFCVSQGYDFGQTDNGDPFSPGKLANKFRDSLRSATVEIC